jgi:hypothetical protein
MPFCCQCSCLWRCAPCRVKPHGLTSHQIGLQASNQQLLHDAYQVSQEPQPRHAPVHDAALCMFF